MRFEKLNENKIRITLTSQDLLKKNVDFHSFMASPIESQSLFFDVLDEAEKEIGFSTKNYNIKLEAFQVTGGDFILTVTRFLPNDASSGETKKKLHIKRKNLSKMEETSAIYCFDSFDNFCEYSSYIYNMKVSLSNIAKTISLYEYNNKYFLVFNNINIENTQLKRVFSAISEFATYISNSQLYYRKLVENATVVIKNNALKTASIYFHS